jgi:hypothetical protein
VQMLVRLLEAEIMGFRFVWGTRIRGWRYHNYKLRLCLVADEGPHLFG